MAAFRIVSQLFSTFIARGVASASGLLLAIAIGRSYGVAEFGAYAVAESILILFVLLSRGGMDQALMRFIGRNVSQSSHACYIYALRMTITRSLLLTPVLAVLPLLTSLSPNMAGLTALLPYMAASLVPMAMTWLSGGYLKGRGQASLGVLLEMGAVSLLAAMLIGILRIYEWLANEHMSPSLVVGSSICGAAWIVGFAIAVSLRKFYLNALLSKKSRIIKYKQAENSHELNEFSISSRAFFFMNLVTFTQQYGNSLLIGSVATQHVLGIFKVAEKAANAVNLVQKAINAIMPPRFAQLFHVGKHRELSQLARFSSLLSTALSAPLLILCLLAPNFVLNLFGNGFTSGATLLRILAVAQVLCVTCGSVSYLLSMTGYENLMRNITIVIAIAALCGYPLITWYYGALGAAIWTAMLWLGQNITALIFVRKNLGIWAFPKFQLDSVMRAMYK